MNVSPEITQKLHDALAVIVLSRGSREALSAADPKAFQQAYETLAAADPVFPTLLANVRGAETQADEAARLARGGFYVEVDGRPWCQAPSNMTFDTHLEAIRTRPLSSRVLTTCWHPNEQEALDHLELATRVLKDHKVLLKPGACPRKED